MDVPGRFTRYPPQEGSTPGTTIRSGHFSGLQRTAHTTAGAGVLVVYPAMPIVPPILWTNIVVHWNNYVANGILAYPNRYFCIFL